jgi:hypothetical protein
MFVKKLEKKTKKRENKQKKREKKLDINVRSGSGFPSNATLFQ